jgi:hypothetical protein
MKKQSESLITKFHTACSVLNVPTTCSVDWNVAGSMPRGGDDSNQRSYDVSSRNGILLVEQNVAVVGDGSSHHFARGEVGRGARARRERIDTFASARVARVGRRALRRGATLVGATTTGSEPGDEPSGGTTAAAAAAAAARALPRC